MNRIVPLTPELLAWAVLEEADPLTAAQAQQPGWDAQFLRPDAIGGALIGQGRVLAAGGLVPIWPGRGMAWLMLSPRARRRDRYQALQHVRTRLDQAQQDPAWRRIEMYVRAGEPWCERFAMHMGMQCEGTMRRFDQFGRDYRLFARVAGES